MRIQDTPIWSVVGEILNSDQGWIRNDYDVTLHTSQEDIKIMQWVSLDIERDYLSAISDVYLISFKMGLGEYRDKVYPYRFNLEITLKDVDDPTHTIRFKAILLDDNVKPTGSKQDSMSSDVLDTAGFINVKLQLMDRIVEPFRVKQVSGVFRDAVPTDIIHSVSKDALEAIETSDGYTVSRIHIEPPNNTTEVRQTLIPSGTRVVELPAFLQNKGTGIYVGGIANYIQYYKGHNTYFVYSPYNYDRYEKETPRLTVYAIPDSLTKLTEKTWKYIDGNLHVLVTNRREVKDDAEASMIESGIGYKFMDATRPMRNLDPENKAYNPVIGYGVKSLMDNIIGAKAKERSDGLDYSLWYKSSINPFKHQSLYNRKLGMFVTFSWMNSKYDDIYPGMPCKYVYFSKDRLVEITGTVSYIHTYIDRERKGHSMVTLFVQKPENMVGL